MGELGTGVPEAPCAARLGSSHGHELWHCRGRHFDHMPPHVGGLLLGPTLLLLLVFGARFGDHRGLGEQLGGAAAEGGAAVRGLPNGSCRGEHDLLPTVAMCSCGALPRARALHTGERALRSRAAVTVTRLPVPLGVTDVRRVRDNTHRTSEREHQTRGQPKPHHAEARGSGRRSQKFGGTLGFCFSGPQI